jgi:hypothetical protein
MNFSEPKRFYPPHAESAGFSRERAITPGFFFLIVIIFIFSIIPIVWFKYLPLADYPNHLARLQIHKFLSSDPYLSKFFEFSWAMIPNLGFDLLTLPFIYLVPVELAGKIAVIISVLIIYVGIILLDRQLNHHNWGLSLFAGIFFYGGALRFGFISYVIGVAFAIFAFWMWVRYREKADGIWILVFTIAAAVIFFAHLFAFGIYAVSVASYECSLLWVRLRREGRLRISLLKIPMSATAILIMPLMLLWFSPLSFSSGRSLWVWSSFARKLDGLAAPIFYSDPVFEIPLLVIMLGLFGWALATRTIVANSLMIIPLGVFGIVFVVMPYGLISGSEYADYRLPSAVVFIALASFAWGNTSPIRRKIICLFLSICLIVRVGSVFLEWQPAQAIIEEYDTALQLLPPGSRLLVYVAPNPFGDRYPPLRHVPVLAAAMHEVFDPDTFANGGKVNGSQLLNLKSDYRDYWTDGPPSRSRIKDIKRFDYLIEIGQPLASIPAGTTLEEIKRGRTFVLYRIRQ